jgi:antagonist of KipI
MAEGLRAIDPGLFTTVQDLGRPGFREWGYPVSGAFDGRSAAIANAFLGDKPSYKPGWAVLEMTLSGGVFEAECPLAIALAGASTEASILGTNDTERAFRAPGCGMIGAGEKLIVGRIREGARVYLAVRGGWQTPMDLGSRSSEIRVKAGDLVPTRGVGLPIASRHLRDWGWVDPSAEPLRILDGPDRDYLAACDPGWWDGREWRVGAKSNRMGLRLEGPAVDLTPATTAERLSAPVAPGAIQVAGGALIVLGVACGTMGGYPHVAHVISADLGRLGQLGPGNAVRFRRVELNEARALDATSRVADRALADRIRLAASDPLMPRIVHSPETTRRDRPT